MSATVVLARPLRRLADGATTLEVEAATVAEALEQLCQVYPSLRDRVFSTDGLRQDLRVFVNRKDIRALHGAETPLVDGDEVSLVPLVAGA